MGTGNIIINAVTLKSAIALRCAALRCAALQLHTSGFSMTRASRLAALFILLVLAATEAAPALADGTIDFAYGGRITEANGKPI